MDISEIINDRIKSSGKSQAEIAKEIDTTPSQLGLFLKGEASLTRR
jgi:transcriptional regulator with XRE-family HTH domain